MTKTEVEKYFYPRPPRGGRPTEDSLSHFTSIFLSTPSARRATCAALALELGVLISIHALREEGDCVNQPHFIHFSISIHALREEGDLPPNLTFSSFFSFLSTPSARRATHRPQAQNEAQIISIHALREEGDAHQRACEPDLENFYPRPPRGGRLLAALAVILNAVFLSTPSARRATKLASPLRRALTDFYPRPPRGGRRKVHVFYSFLLQFLSTPSARRAT